MTDFGALAEQLDSKLTGRVETNLVLAPLTTYRVGGRAEIFVEPSGVADLELLARLLQEQEQGVPVLPLGRGSNLLFSDRGYPGVVVRLSNAFGKLEGSDGRVVAGAGVSLPQLTNWAARRGLAGVEFAIAIPGSVGGGVRMNAGAHGGEVADVLERVRVIDLATGEATDLSGGELGLAYRKSQLTDPQIVIEAHLTLNTDDPAAVKDRVEGYRRHRAETQPPAVQNAGSVFKNPPGDHAGRLVDAAGLKGFAVGAAAVSELHANFFIAGRDATAQDVFDLIHAVRERVHEASGIWLEPEVRFVGSFDGSEDSA